MKANKKYDQFCRTLEAMRSELLEEAFDREDIRIEHTAEDLERLQQHLDREVVIRNLDRTARQLKEVEAALGRIEDETYGVCLLCEEPISEKRLKAVPWAAYCIGCQERAESEHDERTGDDGLGLAAA